MFSGKVAGQNIYQKTIIDFVTNISDTKYMVPDLLIHIRNPYGNIDTTGDKNIIAIEIKTKGDKNTIAIDYAKLCYLTCETADYKYDLGVHIDFES